MEWIETTGKTVEEARERALDQLGVAADEAEFETLEEPRSGLFGRPRGTARVRARVMPRAPRPKTERKRRTRKGGSNGNNAGRAEPSSGSNGGKDRAVESDGRGEGGTSRTRRRSVPADERNEGSTRRGEQDMEQGRADRESMDQDEQIQVLETFLVELAAGFGLTVTPTSHFEDNVLTVDLAGEGLGLLVGPRLATLDAVQEVARHALQRQAAGREYAKVVVDVQGIRARRLDALTEFVHRAAQRARDEATDVVLEIMSSVDRKHVHDVVATLDDIESSSEGEDPRRRVVLRSV